MHRELTCNLILLIWDLVSSASHHSSPTEPSNPSQPQLLLHADQCTTGHLSTVLQDSCHRKSQEAWSHNSYCRAYWASKLSRVQQLATPTGTHATSGTYPINFNDENTAVGKEKLPCHRKKVNLTNENEMFYWVSSVWCYSSPESSLQCTFENLWYNLHQQEFVFVFGPSSIVYGIDRIHSLQDKLFLSSIEGHNAFTPRITVLDWNVARNIGRRCIVKKSIIMSRFKPNNIHHVIHDDLIPLYFTLREMCHNIHDCMHNITIMLTDTNPKGIYWNLYQMLSNNIMIASELKGWLVFESARIGLNKLSVWYQYGFGKIQGPAVTPGFSGYHLREFTRYVMHKFSIYKPTPEPSVEHGVLVSRKTNRKILNEYEMLKVIRDQLSDHGGGKGAKVHAMSLEENTIKEFIVAVSQARVMVGVHGSALTLAMFLPPGSVLIEIWPYGINPDAVQVYRAMCELRDFGVIYIPWMNKDKVNSVYHPEYPAHYGGISHLPVQEQNKLLQLLYGKSVEELQCCDSIEWLMRIYQDTLVYIHDIGPYYKSAPFATVLEYAVKKSDQYLAKYRSSHNFLVDVYPSKVQELWCNLEQEGDHTKLRMRWKDPWNVDNLHCEVLWFEIIWKSGKNSEPVTEYTYGKVFVRNLNVCTVAVDVWVTCYCNGCEGSVLYTKCTHGS